MTENVKPSNSSSSGGGGGGKPIMFAHMRNLQIIRSAPSYMHIPEKLFLDNVAAYNVHLDVGDNKTSSIVTLREVPAFLIEAFSRFGQLEGCKVEGIFRKEGNPTRLKQQDVMPVFYGAQKIPSNFLVHDVCVWIKRFFREIRKPLFGDVEREIQLVKFAGDLAGDITGEVLFTSLMIILQRLPSSHMGALSYLMRCLQEIAEKADVHQMTIDNLATVFAPSLFRGSAPLDAKLTKKQKHGSQEDLLKDFKKTNELQILVLRILIENAEKIGVAKDCYKASRRPSDLKKKDRKLITSSMQKNQEVAISSKPPIGCGNSGVMPLTKNSSRSITNLASDPSSSSSSLLSKNQQQLNSDDEYNRRKAKQRRSNSVVRVFGALRKNFKKSLTNLSPAENFMDTPEPPILATKKIPPPNTFQNYQNQSQQSPLFKHSVSMDPSTTATSSDDTINSDYGRRRNKDVLSDIRKIMSPKEKKRPPIPDFDMPSSSNDEKKENLHEESFENNTPKKINVLRKRSSSNSKKQPMGESNVVNIQRAATQMVRRAEPIKKDRERRQTAPVNPAIKRNQPNSRYSGLTLSRKARTFRRSSSRRTGSPSSNSSWESSFDLSQSQGQQTAGPFSSQEINEKGYEAKRRRRPRKSKEINDSLTNVLGASTIISPILYKSHQQQSTNSISPVLSSISDAQKKEKVKEMIIENSASDIPMSSSPELHYRAIPAMSSISSISNVSSQKENSPKASGSVISVSSSPTKSTTNSPPLSVDVNVTTSTTTTTNTPRRDPTIPFVIPSPDSGCSSASSKHLQSSTTSDSQILSEQQQPPIFLKPELPKRFIRGNGESLNPATAAKIDMKSNGTTSIFLPTQSSLAKMKNPTMAGVTNGKSGKSPIHRSPPPPIGRRSSSVHNNSRETSKSPSRNKMLMPPPESPKFNLADYKNDLIFDNKSKHFILNSKTNGELNPEFGRPSIAKIQGTGVVNRRIQQFKNLSGTNAAATPSRYASSFAPITERNSSSSSNNNPTTMSSTFKPKGSPVSHGMVWNNKSPTTTNSHHHPNLNNSENSTKSHQQNKYISNRTKSSSTIIFSSTTTNTNNPQSSSSSLSIAAATSSSSKSELVSPITKNNNPRNECGTTVFRYR